MLQASLRWPLPKVHRGCRTAASSSTNCEQRGRTAEIFQKGPGLGLQSFLSFLVVALRRHRAARANPRVSKSPSLAGPAWPRGDESAGLSRFRFSLRSQSPFYCRQNTEAMRLEPGKSSAT